MTTDRATDSIPNRHERLDQLHQRLNQIEERITAPDFLACKGLGNEVPFHIFDYPAECELQVREYIQVLIGALKSNHPGLRFAHVNLFELMVSILESRKLLQHAFEMQRTKGDEALKRNLRGVLGEAKVAQAIVDATDPAQQDLIIIHGIGTAWPLIRAHQVISGLEPLMHQKPCIFFYPGTYTGLNLRLFDRLDSQDHYRAFRLVN